jgi:hypothetical protein
VCNECSPTSSTSLLPILNMRSCSISLALVFNCILISRVKSAGLFPFETVQFHESDLAALPTEYAHLFAFSTPSPLSSATCKVFPGDQEWPNDVAWALLNTTTINGGLVKTILIAEPCYAGPVYNADKCSYITAQ